ncbi:MAG TPA: ATP-binding protein, partial [Fimbriimonadaceae bacterium]|nr:ATP-binding protein [Fimbriimonadaceae bacterium]
GQLTAAIAHEVNQPIATARNNASAALRFLNRQQPDLEEVREALDCIVNDTDRASNIISRVRDHIRKAPPVRESFDVNGVVDEILALTRNELIRNGVSVRSSLTAGLPSVRGDRVQVQQVVLNLVVNAVEAMISDGKGARELLICTEPSPEGGVLVAVTDFGPGVDADSAERIFDSFYTTKSRGMGMGLSICRSIVAAHGGRLWVDANAPRGAVFRFTLPPESIGS